MRRALVSLAVPLLLAASSAAAQAPEAPLYAAFQAFCIATGGVPDAVNDAVEQAGGKAHTGQDLPGESTDATAWDIRADGEDLTIVAGTERIPDTLGGPPRDATVCVIDALGRDDASVAAIKQWTGVAPSHVSVRQSTMTAFDFRQVGGARGPVPADPAQRAAAVAAGQIWSLALRQSQTNTSVQIVHIVPERGTP